jgi:hypothetical protein
MAKYVGKDLTVSFGGTALEAEFKKFSTNEEADLVDCSAGTDTNHDYLATLKDGDASLDLLEVVTAGTALWATLAPGNSGTLIWKPNGTVTYTCPTAYVKSRKRDIPFDDVVAISVAFQFSAAVT